MTIDISSVPYPSDDIKVYRRAQTTANIIDVVIEDGVECIDDFNEASGLAQQFAKKYGRENEMALLRGIHEWVQENIPYEADTEAYQDLKSPARAIHDGAAGIATDCKSFTNLTAALLDNLGFDYKVRFAGYPQDLMSHVMTNIKSLLMGIGKARYGNLTHVYPVAITAKGEEVIMDATTGPNNFKIPFNHEVPKIKEYDFEYIKESEMQIGEIRKLSGTCENGGTATNNARLANDAVPTPVNFQTQTPNIALADVPEARFIPYSKLTEGEQTLMLLSRQAEIRAARLPQYASDYRRIRLAIDNVLANGAHENGTMLRTANWGDRFRNVIPLIQSAMRKGDYTVSDTKKSRILKGEIQPLDWYNSNFNYIPEYPRSRIGSVDNYNFVSTCFQSLDGQPNTNINDYSPYNMVNPDATSNSHITCRDWAICQYALPTGYNNRQECVTDFRVDGLLNLRGEEIGPALLNAFMEPRAYDRVINPGIYAKRDRHVTWINTLSTQLGISEDNIRLMLRNGTLCSSVNAHPEEVYQALEKYKLPETWAVSAGGVVPVGVSTDIQQEAVIGLTGLELAFLISVFATVFVSVTEGVTDARAKLILAEQGVNAIGDSTAANDLLGLSIGLAAINAAGNEGHKNEDFQTPSETDYCTRFPQDAACQDGSGGNGDNGNNGGNNGGNNNNDNEGTSPILLGIGLFAAGKAFGVI